MNEASKGIVCKICNKVFSKKSNCNKHIKDIHKVDADGQKLVEEEIACVFCEKKFTTKYSLQRHLDCKHLPDQTNSKLFKCHKCRYSTLYKGNLIRHSSSVDHEKNYIFCTMCNLKCISNKQLKRHERKAHFPRRETKRTCPLCKFTSTDQSLKEIYSHFQNTHEIQLKTEEHNFSSIMDFEQWKNKVETSTTSSFVIRKKQNNVHFYVCHRSGLIRSKGSKKRNSKVLKSCKINGFCPARMVMKIEKDNDIKVSFLKSHVGHKNELNHKRLTTEERKSIAIKLALKIPADQILKDVRNSVINCDLQRIHLITKKDIHNIKKSFNIGDEAVKGPDPVNIQAWVENLETSPNTYFCKSGEGELDESLQSVKDIEEINIVKNHVASLWPTLEDKKKATATVKVFKEVDNFLSNA